MAVLKNKIILFLLLETVAVCMDGSCLKSKFRKSLAVDF